MCLKIIILLSCLLISPLPITVGNFSTEILEAELDTEISRTINSSIEYIIVLPIEELGITSPLAPGEAIRIYTSVWGPSTTYPVIFGLRQQSSMVSWTLPVYSAVDNQHIGEAERTICDSSRFDNPNHQTTVNQTVLIGITTASEDNINFSIIPFTVKKAVIGLDDPIETQVTPFSPQFYIFSFVNASSTDNYVLLEITSPDDHCVTVSVQNATCPILDQENTVEYEGYWQTMTKRSGMTLRRDEYPNGFVIVLVPHVADDRCKMEFQENGSRKLGKKGWFEGSQLQIKDVRIMVKRKISMPQYVGAIIATISFSFLVGAEAVIVIFLQKRYKQRQEQTSSGRDQTEDEPDVPQSVEGSQDEDHVTIRSDNSGSATSLVENDFRFNEGTVSLLNFTTKPPTELSKKYMNYFWLLTTVAMFYSLPVIQLVVTYQKMLHTTGNQDLCYYNYLCSHPWWIFSDFNHILSNVGYIGLGMVFLGVVLRRASEHRALVMENPQLATMGIPKHFGLFYAMGLALMVEGIMSASYHVCPNHDNFQFDTAFMYITAGLLMIQIYQSRHPDICLSATSAFFAMAFVVFCGVIGVLFGGRGFWIPFCLFHIILVLYTSFKIYYFGEFKLGSHTFTRVWDALRSHDVLQTSYFNPLYMKKMIFLVLVNLVNLGLAISGMTKASDDFATHLLMIFMTNLMLYFLFYIIMKIISEEYLTKTTWIYIGVSLVLWIASGVLFFIVSTSWQLSPSESRALNKECILFGFFDSHDLWHLLSAGAMFTSFMVLLNIDDNIMQKTRESIPVF